KDVIEISDAPDFRKYTELIPPSTIACFVYDTENRTYFELTNGKKLTLSPELEVYSKEIIAALDSLHPHIPITQD
ncbi:MAG: hypothetical protein AAF357_12720, partial [Verrucomicrobiota bacterium]